MSKTKSKPPVNMLNPEDYMETEPSPNEGVGPDAQGITRVRLCVSGRYLTYVARERWLQGKIEHAITILTEGCNMDESTAVAIITGRKTLRGWNNLTLEPDNVKMPSLRDVMHRAGEDLEHFQDRAEKLRQKLDEEVPRIQGYGLVDSPPDPEERLEALKKEKKNQLSRIVQQEAAWSRQDKEYQKRMKWCEPDPDFVSDSGWLSPDGKYYSCEYQDHIHLADDLVQKFEISGKGAEEGRLEDLGWAKCTASRWVRMKPLTQKQIDAIFDWSLKHGPTFEFMGQRDITYEQMLKIEEERF